MIYGLLLDYGLLSEPNHAMAILSPGLLTH